MLRVFVKVLHPSLFPDISRSSSTSIACNVGTSYGGHETANGGPQSHGPTLSEILAACLELQGHTSALARL
jgi:hypothetical protein